MGTHRVSLTIPATKTTMIPFRDVLTNDAGLNRNLLAIYVEMAKVDCLLPWILHLWDSVYSFEFYL